LGKNDENAWSNCPGIVTPGREIFPWCCRLGYFSGYFTIKDYRSSSRSGTLTYEAVWQLTSRGVGQSTCVGIGGDPVHGLSHLDIIKMFNDDPDTHGIIIIGEIGGTSEEQSAEWIKHNCKKPIAAFVAGSSEPPGDDDWGTRGQSSVAQSTAAAKIAAFKDAGVAIAPTPADFADTLLKIMFPIA
jgi:succinyl-CoA synthetase alpha subunit